MGSSSLLSEVLLKVMGSICDSQVKELFPDFDGLHKGKGIEL